VTEFVKIINKAKTLEDGGHSGMGLTYYLKAKRIYPNSMYAESGITRILDDVLPSSGSLVSKTGDRDSTTPEPLSFD
jgi:hypothetical protein